MAKKQAKNPADYIVPLYMNGLQGRMLRLPPPKTRTREILLIYGHHATLERMFGVAEDLNKYGGITLPDLPGFGGMQSFYHIGEKPTLDNLADYLAAFVKLRYKNRRLTIIAVSFGFLVVARMLQRYPELTKKVDLLISLVGFVHKDDFHLSRREFMMLRYGGSIFSRRLSAWLFRHLFLNPTVIRFTYRRVAHNHAKLKNFTPEEREKLIDFEIGLWQANDVRTRMDTMVTMFTADICDRQVAVPTYHVMVKDDRYFDNHIVEQHLRIIFDDLTIVQSKMDGHAPTIIADAEEAAPLIPTKIRRLLATK